MDRDARSKGATEPSLGGPVMGGLSAFEASLLEAVASVTDVDRPFGSSVDVISEVARLCDRDRFEALDLTSRCVGQQWVPCPIVVGSGHWGSYDSAPVDPEFTQLGLSEIGSELVRQANDVTAPPVPIELINGNIHVGGSSPPFTPMAVMTSLQLSVTSPASPSVNPGLPWSGTGAFVEGDADRLSAGGRCEFRLRFRFRDEGDRAIVYGFLPEVGPRRVMDFIVSRSSSQDWSLREQFETDSVGRVVDPGFVELVGPRQELVSAMEMLHDGTTVTCQLDEPWHDLASNWIRQCRGQAPTAFEHFRWLVARAGHRI